MSDKKEDGFLKRSYVTQTMGYTDVSQKHEVWAQISKQFNGLFKIKRTSSNVLEILSIDIPYENYTIKLSESDVHPLKVEIEFQSQLNFELIIGCEDFFDRLLKHFGKKEIEIGHQQFDKRYTINSPDVELTKRILSTQIADSIIAHDIYSISYLTDAKLHTSQLTTAVSRNADSKAAIEGLIALHIRLIDKLKELLII